MVRQQDKQNDDTHNIYDNFDNCEEQVDIQEAIKKANEKYLPSIQEIIKENKYMKRAEFYDYDRIGEDEQLQKFNKVQFNYIKKQIKPNNLSKFVKELKLSNQTIDLDILHQLEQNSQQNSNKQNLSNPKNNIAQPIAKKKNLSLQEQLKHVENKISDEKKLKQLFGNDFQPNQNLLQQKENLLVQINNNNQYQQMLISKLNSNNNLNINLNSFNSSSIRNQLQKNKQISDKPINKRELPTSSRNDGNVNDSMINLNQNYNSEQNDVYKLNNTYAKSENNQIQFKNKRNEILQIQTKKPRISMFLEEKTKKMDKNGLLGKKNNNSQNQKNNLAKINELSNGNPQTINKKENANLIHYRLKKKIKQYYSFSQDNNKNKKMAKYKLQLPQIEDQKQSEQNIYEENLQSHQMKDLQDLILEDYEKKRQESEYMEHLFSNIAIIRSNGIQDNFLKQSQQQKLNQIEDQQASMISDDKKQNSQKINQQLMERVYINLYQIKEFKTTIKKLYKTNLQKTQQFLRMLEKMRQILIEGLYLTNQTFKNLVSEFNLDFNDKIIQIIFQHVIIKTTPQKNPDYQKRQLQLKENDY